jgi:pyrimidine deaminase RibD-like protein
MNFHDLDNYNLADAVKFHHRLNPRLWGKDEHLLPDVRDKLLAIASDFQEFLGVDDLNIQDITISGSNAAYSYTRHSDIDLHLVVDMPDDPVYQELFAAKKFQYNAEHDIKIAGVPVELYVQPSDQKHVSQGIYSVKNGDWTQVPQRRRASVDDSCVQHKTADLDARIHSAIRSGDADAVNQLWEKIRTMRQTGLEKNGEFGCENIAFKLLRNSGCLTKLKKAKTAIQDRELSLAREPAPRKKMNYGMRDYWYPGTAYAGQDHPAGSESEQVDESTDPDQLKKILHRFYASCVDKLQLKNPPQLRLETTPDWSQENGSFGQYESETNTLILATHGRHVLDILRTMAHEMTHRQQDEREPLPTDAGETGSPYEDQANAMAGRIMRQWAEEQPEMFDGVTLEEASGYIPTRKQARDPRFVMALTRDVRPGAVGKEANKLGLQTDSQGHPALLTAGLQKLLREFKEQDLFEINMGGKSLRREAAKTGALAGMEFEMIVPDVSGDDDGELEPDWDTDQSARSFIDIEDFFYDGDYNSRRDVQNFIAKLQDDYSEWQGEQFSNRWDADTEVFIYDYLRDNVDDDSIRDLLDLEPDDDITRKEYLLAADMIVTEKMEPWYEDALDSARDDFYENDNVEEWLSDENLDSMRSIHDAYSGDIQWPYYEPSGGGGSNNVQDITDSFSEAVGRPARASDSYHAYGQERPGPGKNFYVVEPDGSLDPDDHNDSGLEFVSPPLPIDEIMSDLNKVKDWADKTGCYTNKSTGLHINISVPNYSIDRLDYVKLALLMGDEYVLEKFGRASNTYAKSALSKIRGKITPENAKQILDTMKSGMSQLATKAIHTGYTDKYTSINTKDGHIEFRSPGGDWLNDNFSMIENTLLRFTVAMSAAMDPKAYRQEYLKKLYKMLAPKGEDDPIAIFAKYAAGEFTVMPKETLKFLIGKLQQQRAAKKSGEDIVAAPAAGVDQTAPHPEGRGRPNDPTGLYAIVRRSDPRNYGSRWGSEAPDYLFRFSLPDGFDRAGSDRAVLAAWAARERVDSNDYMVVNTTQFAAPAQTAAPEESNQGNWGVWVPSLDRFVTTRGNSATRRFMRHGDAQAWIQDFNARNAESDLELSVREIEPTTAQAAPGSGSVRWNIINGNNEIVHTFWNRNVQADANEAARQWLINNDSLPSVDDQEPFEVVPAAIPGSTQDLQRQRIAAASMAADAAPSAASQLQQAAMSNVTNPPYYPPPTPIPGVQDIDIDIPMAQTQWEVYNRSSGQPVFRMTAADQAEAWRRGQAWVANARSMDPAVDAANFSVRPSAQPVSESREITKLHKLDSVLEKCINMIHRGQESDPKKYGRVAACLIDNKNNHTYAINLPGPDHTRRHAERVAIDLHLKRHGRIGPNAIMVTTLSPCVNHMSERDGESCTDLLSDYGIEKCYAGWQDPTQQPATDYPFNLQVTDNADIFNTCQHIAASFLPQGMANELTEEINPDCFDPAFNDTQIFDGLTYRASAVEENGKQYFQIKVFDDNFQTVGLAKFRPSKGGVSSVITSFKPEYRGQGIARNIYAYVRMLGNTIVPSRNQLPPGKAMWDAWKKSGDAKHLMRDVAESKKQ